MAKVKATLQILGKDSPYRFRIVTKTKEKEIINGVMIKKKIKATKNTNDLSDVDPGLVQSWKQKFEQKEDYESCQIIVNALTPAE